MPVGGWLLRRRRKPRANGLCYPVELTPSGERTKLTMSNGGAQPSRDCFSTPTVLEELLLPAFHSPSLFHSQCSQSTRFGQHSTSLGNRVETSLNLLTEPVPQRHQLHRVLAIAIIVASHLIAAGIVFLRTIYNKEPLETILILYPLLWKVNY